MDRSAHLPERWTVAHGPLRFELKRTDFGHLGLFPEQAENWDWIGEMFSSRRHGGLWRFGADVPSAAKRSCKTFKLLNLFAYTGGSTLAAAAAGAEVVHVDAAKNIVAWARRNAELSGLAEAPIRWIAEDAMKFVKRELKRGNRYDAVILDPPSYGHGPQGEVWRLSKHSAAAAGAVRRVDGRAAGVHAIDVPHARLRCGTADRDAGRAFRRWSRRPDRGETAFDPRRRRSRIAQRRRGAMETRKQERCMMQLKRLQSTITSPQNPHVKDAVRLRDRRHREKQGRILIDGARELHRAIAAGVRLVEAFVCEPLCQSDDAQRLLAVLAQSGCDVLRVSQPVFEKLAFGQRAEGVLGVAETPRPTLSSLTLGGGGSSTATPTGQLPPQIP